MCEIILIIHLEKGYWADVPQESKNETSYLWKRIGETSN